MYQTSRNLVQCCFKEALPLRLQRGRGDAGVSVEARLDSCHLCAALHTFSGGCEG